MKISQDIFDTAHDAFHDVYDGDNFDKALRHAIECAIPAEPTEAMYLAAKDCTPVTKDSPDYKRTVYSIYTCMFAALEAALSAQPVAKEGKVCPTCGKWHLYAVAMTSVAAPVGPNDIEKGE